MSKETRNAYDLAWIALPQKVREEVRRNYSSALQTDNISYAKALEDTFGCDNVRSSLEPEEVLVVSRSKVQNMYKKLFNLQHSTSSMHVAVRSTYEGGVVTLYDLFGKKCLSDEEINTSLKMPYTYTFKEGDYVKILESEAESLVGAIGKIVSYPSESNLYNYGVELYNGDITFQKEGVLEKYDKNCNISPKFKIGQKVVTKLNGSVRTIDRIVYTAKGFRYMDKEHGEWIYECGYEPYTTSYMNKKTFNLCKVLKGCEGETIYLPDVGVGKICEIKENEITVDIGDEKMVRLLAEDTLCITSTGFAFAYPSREAYLAYPLDALQAWKEWEEERKEWIPNDNEYYWFINNMLNPVSTIFDEECFEHKARVSVGNYFRTQEEAREAAEIIKSQFIKFHTK